MGLWVGHIPPKLNDFLVFSIYTEVRGPKQKVRAKKYESAYTCREADLLKSKAMLTCCLPISPLWLVETRLCGFPVWRSVTLYANYNSIVLYPIRNRLYWSVIHCHAMFTWRKIPLITTLKTRWNYIVNPHKLFIVIAKKCFLMKRWFENIFARSFESISVRNLNYLANYQFIYLGGFYFKKTKPGNWKGKMKSETSNYLFFSTPWVRSKYPIKLFTSRNLRHFGSHWSKDIIFCVWVKM